MNRWGIKLSLHTTVNTDRRKKNDVLLQFRELGSLRQPDTRQKPRSKRSTPASTVTKPHVQHLAHLCTGHTPVLAHDQNVECDLVGGASWFGAGFISGSGLFATAERKTLQYFPLDNPRVAVCKMKLVTQQD